MPIIVNKNISTINVSASETVTAKNVTTSESVSTNGDFVLTDIRTTEIYSSASSFGDRFITINQSTKVGNTDQGGLSGSTITGLAFYGVATSNISISIYNAVINTLIATTNPGAISTVGQAPNYLTFSSPLYIEADAIYIVLNHLANTSISVSVYGNSGDGIGYYSTNGGVSWIDGAPGGGLVSPDYDISVRYTLPKSSRVTHSVKDNQPGISRAEKYTWSPFPPSGISGYIGSGVLGASFFSNNNNITLYPRSQLYIDYNAVNGSPCAILNHNANTGNNVFLHFNVSSVTRGSIDFNRAAGQVRYNTTSDSRLKKEIAPSDSAKAIVNAIEVATFKLKENDYQVTHGFIAQDLFNVVPDAVSEGDKKEEIEQAWSVDYSKLVPYLTKALQETMEELKALKEEFQQYKKSNP